MARTKIEISLTELQVDFMIQYLCSTVTSHAWLLCPPKIFLSRISQVEQNAEN